MFCPKMSRYLTHMKKLNDPEDSFAQFFEVFTPLKRKLGPVLIQLLPSLHFHIDKAELYISFVKRNINTTSLQWKCGISRGLKKKV